MEPKPTDRLSVNQFMAAETSFADLLDWSERRQVTGIGVLRSTVDKFGTATVRSMLADHGVTPTSLCVFLGLVHPEASVRRTLLTDAAKALDDAREIGAPLVVVAGGPSPGLPLAEAKAQFVDQLLALDGYAAANGGELLLEPLNPAAVHLSCLTSLAESISVLETCRATGLVIDFWHSWTDPDLHAVLETHANRLSVVHVSDWPLDPVVAFQREIPGRGLIDLTNLVAALRRAGFAGWWELEVFAETEYTPRGDGALLTASLEGLRTALADTGGTAFVDSEGAH
ncbi:sugar phosphate isomerase/epimerase family protein [Kribbella sp. NPDC056345]|uniref:sugar phosphate isomerase/epimerase family protein n=1 Tax=Kribbella sp. NPDC056345 TaxID=3345789 RepID=UPI0035E18C50